MSNLIRINNQQLEVKEFKGQRVVTFKDIDRLHERTEGTAKRNFNANAKHFVEGVDFYFVKPVDVQTYEIRTSEINNAGTYLITESGYLMLVKSLTDSLAWEVQRELVNNYFRFKEIVKADGMKVISLLHAEVGELIAATSQIENRVENLENTMTIDYSQQLILQELARSTAIEAMGGKENKAYNDSSLRSKVFSQVWKDYKEYFNVNSYRNTSRVDFMKAKEYLRNWKPQGKLLRSIEDLNSDVEEGFI